MHITFDLVDSDRFVDMLLERYEETTGRGGVAAASVAHRTVLEAGGRAG